VKKIQNPFRYKFPARPDRREYESDEQWIRAEIEWWEKKNRRYMMRVLACCLLAVVVGLVIALGGAK
jgi:hypothetical protein